MISSRRQSIRYTFTGVILTIRTLSTTLRFLSCDYLLDGSNHQIRSLEHDVVTTVGGNDVCAVGREIDQILLQALPGGIDLFTSCDDHQRKVPQRVLCSRSMHLGGAFIPRGPLVIPGSTEASLIYLGPQLSCTADGYWRINLSKKPNKRITPNGARPEHMESCFCPSSRSCCSVGKRTNASSCEASTSTIPTTSCG